MRYGNAEDCFSSLQTDEKAHEAKMWHDSAEDTEKTKRSKWCNWCLARAKRVKATSLDRTGSQYGWPHQLINCFKQSIEQRNRSFRESWRMFVTQHAAQARGEFELLLWNKKAPFDGNFLFFGAVSREDYLSRVKKNLHVFSQSRFWVYDSFRWVCPVRSFVWRCDNHGRSCFFKVCFISFYCFLFIF